MIIMTSMRATDVANEWVVTFHHDDGTEEYRTVTGQAAHDATIEAEKILVDLNAS